MDHSGIGTKLKFNWIGVERLHRDERLIRHCCGDKARRCQSIEGVVSAGRQKMNGAGVSYFIIPSLFFALR